MYLGTLGADASSSELAQILSTDPAFAATYGAAALAASPELRAAFVAGNVYNSDGSHNTTKTLHVVLTADGTDIADLVIV